MKYRTLPQQQEEENKQNGAPGVGKQVQKTGIPAGDEELMEFV